MTDPRNDDTNQQDAPFPVKLPRRNAPTLFPHVPGQAPNASFGRVDAGIPLPPGGAAYVVQADPADPQHVRVLAYLDHYGRLFSADGPLAAPPARYPTLQLFSDVDDGSDEATIDVFDSTGRSRTIAQARCRRLRLGGLRATLTALDAPATGDTRPLFEEHDANDLLALCYLACIALPAHSDEGVFNLGTIYERLANPNVLDAVNREVLEAQAAWAEDPHAATGLERYLVHLLLENGTVGKSADELACTLDGEGLDGPNARLIRTSDYADTYFVDFFYNSEDACVEDGGFRSTPATAQPRTLLLGCESALNRFLLLARRLQRQPGGMAADLARCSQLDLQGIDEVCAQLAEIDPPEEARGLWNTHYNFARGCELLALPYRFTCRYATAPETGAFGVEVLCPPAEAMPKSRFVATDGTPLPIGADEQRHLADTYAAHTALLACGLALASSPDVDRVLVNCLNEPDAGAQPIVSLDTTRAAFLACQKRHGAAFPQPFAALDELGARVNRGGHGGLLPVAPFFQLGVDEFAGTLETSVRDDATAFNEEAQALTGVHEPRELSIFEEGERIAASRQVLGALESQGVDGAIDVLKNLHDRTEDLALRKLFSDLLDGFAAGTIDESSYLEVSEAFSDAYGFKAPMTYAYALINDDEEEKAIPVLEGLLKQTRQLQGFDDTATTCYRYFDSYATRVLYAWKCADDAAGREVRQLPDEVYLAHDAMTQVLARQIGGDGKDALFHAQECIRLAPGRANSYLRAARVHFMQDDWANEIEMCKKALSLAWNPEDAGLAYYWMGFAYWQLQKFELASACYRRSIALGCSMADSAREEMDELAQNVAGLQHRTFDAETEILLRAGIPTRALRENAARIMAVAKASADSGCVSLACVLAATAQRVLHDDALMPCVHSFERMTKED